jgi:hypothetical protein
LEGWNRLQGHASAGFAARTHLTQVEQEAAAFAMELLAAARIAARGAATVIHRQPQPTVTMERDKPRPSGRGAAERRAQLLS